MMKRVTVCISIKESGDMAEIAAWNGAGEVHFGAFALKWQ